MDLATLLGLLIGWGAVVGSMIMEGGELSSMIMIPAFVLVIGGTIGATMTSYPLQKMIGLAPVLKNAFLGKHESPKDVIKQMVEFTRIARRDGILALEAESRDLDNRLLKSGIQLIVDGTPEDVVRGILETEVMAMQERHQEGASVFATMGGYAPTMGVIGTVMGLVHMLNNMNDPGKMGPMIASAFIATLYGVSFANLLFLPLGQKLKSRTAEEVANYEMMIEGIVSILSGDSPRIVEAKMIAFCPPKLRAGILAQEAA
jgi:chemotaxis protein MotA